MLPALRACLTFRPNSSLYRAAARYRYNEGRSSGGARSYHLVAVEGSAIGRIEFVVEVRPEHGDSIRRIEMDVGARP